jgi:molybdopterin-synthase adenylyltransferase
VEFSADEIERYARQLVLPDIGGPGQQRLKRTRLLIVGAGGLGVPVATYCAAAGIGRIGIADHDRVSLSNLHRQVLFRTDDVGHPKAEAAASALRRLNPHVAIEPITERIAASNVARHLANYDLVADCTDSADARYAISDACFHARKPLVTAAVVRADGNVTTLKPYETGNEGRPNPTYRCLFPEAPGAAEAACAELGVLGVLAGLIGCIQATEIIKEAAGIGSSLVGRLLLIDGRGLRFETIDYQWDPANALNGSSSAEAGTERPRVRAGA